MVLQDFKAYVAQIFFRDDLKQVHSFCFLLLLLGVFDKIGDGLVIPPSLIVYAAQGLVTGVHDEFVLRLLATGDVVVAKRVFVGDATVVLSTHLGSDLGG